MAPNKKAQRQKQSNNARKRNQPMVQIVRQPAPPPIQQSVGGKVGAFIGDAAQNLIGKIFGLGDYKVSYNSLSPGAGGPPQFNNNPKRRSMLVRHRESLGDVVGSTGFSSTIYTINPSNSSLFPWLSPIACCFEMYRLHGMVFEFKSTSADAVSSTNTALGTVIMATQYNPNDAPFSSKLEMENYTFATSEGPKTSFLHAVECKKELVFAPELYVNQPRRAGAVDDPKTLNAGRFTLATVGMQAAATIGELWVSYEVEFLDPRMCSFLPGPGMGRITASNGIVQNTSLGAFGTTAFAFSAFVSSTVGLAPAYVVTAVETATTALSTTIDSNVMYLTFGTSTPNGISFPYQLFQSKTVLIQIHYVGTTITGNSVLTLGPGCTLFANQQSAFTATVADDSRLLKFDRVSNGGDPNDQCSYVTIQSPPAATLATVTVYITVVG